jgi:hypothetical protein
VYRVGSAAGNVAAIAGVGFDGEKLGVLQHVRFVAIVGVAGCAIRGFALTLHVAAATGLNGFPARWPMTRGAIVAHLSEGQVVIVAL